MREIKFRGKSAMGGEWIYGYYQVEKERKGTSTHWMCGKQAVMIIDPPATVGQYTGLKDKNGVEIYEGDIVKWENENWEIVWFIHGYALSGEPGRCMMADNFNFIVNDKILDVEVVGNVHEHPALLEK